MSGPTFSVIVPAYNASTTIDLTIQSVLDQTFTDFEIVIADDASTDDTYARAVEWADKDERIRTVRLPSNSGDAALPRNAAIKQSRGALLAFLDADDQWYSTKLERQLEKHESGDFAMSYTRCLIESPHDPEKDGRDYHEVWGHRPKHEPSLEDLVRANVVPNVTVVLRREWQERVGLFIPGLSEDWHFWLRVAAHGGRIGFCDEVLALYRWSPSGITHRYGPRERVRKTLIAMSVEFPEHRKMLLTHERMLRQQERRMRLRYLLGRQRVSASSP